jgi:hypothetical protein
MFTPICVCTHARDGRRLAQRVCAVGSLLLAAALGACTAAPMPPVAGAHPADPSAPARPAVYRGVIAGGVSRPSEPAAWQDRNTDVTPGAKP